jgi:hypothetical protein
MADKNILEQMLGHLVNDDQQKAEELFHEYVVAKSREIYEQLIEAEMDDEKDEEMDEAAEDEEAEDEKVDEAAEDDEEEMDENFEQFASEAGDEEADPTDDLESEMDGEMGPEGEERSEEELFMDLDSIVDELQSKFDELKGMEAGEHKMDGDTGEEEMEGFGDTLEPQLATVREYVEKVAGGHGAEKKGQGEGQYSGTGTQSDKVSVNSKSIVAGKNDMGGTTANILSSKEDTPKYAGAGGGQLGGSSLFKGNPKEENFGNVNVPGGNAGKTGFKTKEAGHGAEKKGEAEGKFSGAGGSSGSVDKASLFRGRR